jgi:alpha-glucosidase
MQEVVRYLHDRHQHYILMIDPAVAEYDYPAFNRGREMGIFLKKDNETLFRGVVWPVSDHLRDNSYGGMLECISRA